MASGRGLTRDKSLKVWPGHGESLRGPWDSEKVVRGVPLWGDEDGLPGRKVGLEFDHWWW